MPSSHPLEDSAPFDDINDEPTQIAGKLPSFLSDEEATVVAGDAFGLSPKVAGARAPLPGIGRIEPPAGRKVGADTSPPSAGDLVGWKDALDQLLPSGPPFPAVPTSAAKEVAAPTAAGHAKDKDKAIAKGPAPATEATAEAPKSPAVAPAVPASGQSTPIAATASVTPPARSADAKSPAGATPAPGATATATAARGAADQRRSPAILIGISVVVLAAVAIFLFRFFASQSTETARSTSTPGSSATAAGVSAPGEARGVTTPAPAAPAAAIHEPGTGPDAGTAQAATPPTEAPSATAATGTMPSTGAAEPSVRKVTGKRRTPRADSTPEAAIAAAAPKSGEAASGGGGPAAAAEAPPIATSPSDMKGETPSSIPGDSDGSAHQIRVTSKPDGADVTIDGQTVGKTPFSAGIADIAAPHFIAVRKDGFETFEQMISSSSAWGKTKAPKGKGTLQVLKINAKLKATAGGAAVGDARPTTEPPAPVPATDSAPKVEVVKPGRPMPPVEERPAAESAPK